MGPVLEKEGTSTLKEKAENLLSNAMILVVTKRWLPVSKVVSNKVLNSNADERMISVSKKLFNCKELKQISNNRIAMDAFISRRATPLPMRAGNHVIANDLFNEVENELMNYYNREQEYIAALIPVYEQAVEDAKELLGDQFNAKDYPPVDSVRDYFHLSWTYMKFGLADQLEVLNKEVAERKEQQWQATIVRAEEAANSLLATQFQGVLAHLIERLTPVEKDGELKRKTLRDSMLNPVNDFLTTFAPRNLSGSEDLKNMVEKVKGMLNGVTVSGLKDSADLRGDLQAQFEQVKETVDKFITDQPIRSITFED